MSPVPIRRKLVIVGDGNCGKTSLLSVFSMGDFPTDYEPTIFDNYVAEIRLDGKAVQLALWDTAGQEEYERLRPLSYAKSHVILIAFSLDSPDSLDNVISKWNEEVRSICGETIPVLLVGCKMDLREMAIKNGEIGKGRFVSTAEGEAIALQINARAYKECSALLNEGVDEVFESATRAAMLVRNPGTTSNSNSTGVVTGEVKGKTKGKKSSSSTVDEEKSGGCGCVIC